MLISSNSPFDTKELYFKNRTSFDLGTDFSIKNIRENGLFISSLSDLGMNNSANSLVIKPFGFIGINDAAPTARLSIAGNETTASGLAAAFKIQNTASANSWYFRAGAPGTATPDGGFSIADNGGYHFMMDNNGNLGLGITPSDTKLHINGGIKLQGTNVLEMGAGIAGKETNAGKIVYNGFGINALTIVGAGNTFGTRAVHFAAEAGVTMTGGLDIMRINGNAGTPGQVLVSNGSLDPAWQSAANP